MSKPIFIARFPSEPNLKENYETYHKHLANSLPDYRVICLVDNSVSKVEFECFNVTDFNYIEFDKLCSDIRNNLKTLN